MDDPRRTKGWLRHIGLAAGLAGVLAGSAVTWEPEAAPPPAAPPALDLTSAEPMRQTEPEALAHAVAIGARVEIGALRTESREVYANADGTTTSVDHAEPVRVAKGGSWVPVDATLTVGEDGSIGPKAATIGMRISRGGAEPLISVERAGRQMTLDWPGDLPAPVLHGAKATYAEVLPGVDLVLDAQVTGFSHVLVIKTPEAAANPDLATLEFGLDTENLTVSENAEGGLAAVDPATGDAVLEAAAPIMWDSGQAAPAARTAAAVVVSTEPSETSTVAGVDVAVDGDSIALTPDAAMLTSPATRWPVYVDPVWQSTTNSGWAMVASGYPSEKYWKFKDDEGVGECPVSSGWCNGVGIKRVYYALPTPYAGKTILSAEFRVTMTHTYDSSAQPVQLFRGGSTISSGTTWSNKPSVADVLETKSPKGTQGSCTSTNQNVGFNATDAVKYAVTNNKSTTTFGLKAQDEGEYHAWKRFCGNAILSVNYNRAPVQPKQSELTMNPGGSCVSGASRPYVNKPPTLYMIFRDPDHAPSAGRTESVHGEIQVYWTPAGGTQVLKTFTTGKKASGTTIQYTLSGIPQNTVITWQVRASDGTGWGPWSYEGDTQTACQFVYDATIPPAPDIDSPEYLPADAGETTSDCAEEAADRGSMGTYGTFTFDAPSADTVRYEYGFNSDPSPANVLTPTAAGGPVSIQWLPDTDGPRRITVKGYDKANNPSAVAECHFSVATVNASGEWSMDDPAGGPAADSRGDRPALPGPGAAFGVPGPGCQGTGDECVRDRAVRLDGTASGYLATASGGMIDTSQGFSVAAWVRLTDATRDAVAVSLDGSGEPGFTLGYRAAEKKWAFAVPVTDVDSLGEWKVTAADAPEIGRWTHLAAVFDSVKHTLTIYVNGKASTPAARRSEWRARGPVQIGRAYAKTGYTGFWTGDVANVAVIPRLIQAKEATEMAKLLPVRLAYWPLNEVAGAEAPEYDGGQDLTLAGGATVAVLDDPFGEPALVGTGHLVLDGIDDYAATAGPIAATDGSFTVSLRVRLAATPDAPMTVLSQSGSKAAGFAIRCADGRWEVSLPAADAAGGQITHVIDDQVAVEPTFSGTHLTYVYNAFTNEAKLYVNGQLALNAVADYPKPWKAAGPLQVGRQLVGGAYREHFAGVVDDVRVYAGVAGDAAITRMALLSEQPEL
ncbi:LamG-like jellyroll fold domain-containing protein [Catenuloplanes sp. NPDC051500]|uniref:LamG-like jellyroll fold domain-containing protein n=1 Tax=Catenuloplanes sp. NPDC051500 TaxID=3363959 RepID=UPI00379D4EAD